MNTGYFEYLTASQVQCPKCGSLAAVPLQNNTGFRLEYAGVCDSVLDGGDRCGTTLLLRVTAHLFPMPAESSAGSGPGRT